MKSANQNKAVFIDRDGTINVEKNYVYKIEDFKFIPGIFELIQKYQNQNYLVIIVTNQSGIARGLYTENDFLNLTNWMTGEFKKNGIEIAKVYYCPHHPDITGDCKCRKPGPGMILEAIKDFNINPAKSVLIGDKKSDILAGEKAGIGKNLYIHQLLEVKENLRESF